MTHCDVIAALSDQLPMKVSLERRFIRFIKVIEKCTNFYLGTEKLPLELQDLISIVKKIGHVGH